MFFYKVNFCRLWENHNTFKSWGGRKNKTSINLRRAKKTSIPHRDFTGEHRQKMYSLLIFLFTLSDSHKPPHRLPLRACSAAQTAPWPAAPLLCVRPGTPPRSRPWSVAPPLSAGGVPAPPAWHGIDSLDWKGLPVSLPHPYKSQTR